MTSFEDYKKLWHEAVMSGHLRLVAISGMDGTGKGTLVELIPKYSHKLDNMNNYVEDNADILTVRFPDYETNSGKIIKRLLQKGAHNFLSMEEMMALFAINRLELLGGILTTSYDSLVKNRALRVLFDRFPTCNLVTLGAWIANTGKYLDILDKSHTKKRKNIVEFMLDLEQFLYATLYLDQAKIFVPMVSPKTSIEAIKNDGTRDIVDTYETLQVQEVVNNIYKIFTQENLFPFEIIEQETNGKRLDPVSVARLIKIESCSTKNKSSNFLILRNDKVFPEINQAISDILMKFDGLKKFYNLVCLMQYKQFVKFLLDCFFQLSNQYFRQ
jgi:thymidylate kinase